MLAIAFVPLLGLDVPALHALELSWPIAAGAGAVGALVGAIFAAMLLADRTWFDLAYYGWKRGILLAVLTVVCSLVVHLIVACPLIATVAIGLFAALLACMLLMIASGDLRV
ncbi:MAG TPA: hypothetical protein VFS15_17010 [Kofleriaceae bacterium]|nr:hypothetical protein [Kofleriaceae bacterium]